MLALALAALLAPPTQVAVLTREAAVQAGRLRAVAEGARESSARTRALLQRRFAAGASSEVELARAEVQEMEALQARDQAQAQLGASRATLGVLLGESGPLQETLE